MSISNHHAAEVPDVDPDAADPSEPTTVAQYLRNYAAQGYDTELLVTRQGRVRCLACEHESDPAATTLDSLRRIEGASDPDDLQVVAALVCPNCGAKGAIVVGFGPNASPEDADVLAALDDHRRG